ncbi:MAG: AAA family ATPase [Planctomycetes bacterium]|nr:AAA family ATPase [Planctomycetota bacterium]
MIERIRIQNEASFGDNPQDLKDLSQHNFIFGVNATGKTTISRIIADESAFPHCPVTWRGRIKMETLVYNRDFVDKNFDQSSELKGIFTLGEEDKDTVTKIATAKTELDELVNDLQTLTKTLEGEDGEGGERAELAELDADFAETCWRLKQKHDAKLKGAFAHFRHAKVAFRDKLLAEAQSNSASLESLSDLEKRSETVFGDAPERVVAVSVLEYDDLLRSYCKTSKLNSAR